MADRPDELYLSVKVAPFRLVDNTGSGICRHCLFIGCAGTGVFVEEGADGREGAAMRGRLPGLDGGSAPPQLRARPHLADQEIVGPMASRMASRVVSTSLAFKASA